MNKTLPLIGLFILWSIISCKNKSKYPEGYMEGDENFSITAFIDDQWNSKNHLPWVYAKVTEIDNVITDSVIIEWNEEMVKELKKEFEVAEIGRPGDINQYNVTFLESMNDFTVLYEPVSDKQDVRKQMLSMSPETGIVKSVYTEVNVGGLFYSENKKMTYFTDGMIRIVKQVNPLIGKSKTIVITYKII